LYNDYEEGGITMNSRIALIRKAKEKKQDDFAEELGLTKNFISLVETGKREPSDRTIKDICRIYNVNEEWLRTGEGEMFLPRDREKEIAKLTVELLSEESDSFKNRLISALSRLTEEQWELLAEIADNITKKE
jgi:transcriptional regulator with XRE-family HTH domain